MRWIFTVLFFPILFAANASNLLPMGARSAGLSHATVATYSIFSGFQNTAGLAYLPKFSAGFAVESRYLTPELNSGAFSLAMPSDLGVVGVNVQRFGNDLFNETRYGLSFSKLFSNKIAMGLQLNYFETRIAENYGYAGRLVADFGFLANATEKLTVGAHIFNPTRVNISKNLTEKIPTRFRLGIQYKFSDELLTLLEIEKPIAGKATLKGGAEYQFAEKFFFRLGLSNRPLQNSFGFGIMLGHLRFDLAAQYDQILGISPQVGLIFQPKE